MVTKTGFDAAALIPDIPRLLERGGMLSMLNTVLIAFCAYGFAGTLAVTGSLDIVLNKLMKTVKTTGGLIVATIVSCITAVFVTSNGQLSILIPGEMFAKTYIKKGLQPKNLSRTLEDSATVVERLFRGQQQVFIWQQHLECLHYPIFLGLLFVTQVLYLRLYGDLQALVLQR